MLRVKCPNKDEMRQNVLVMHNIFISYLELLISLHAISQERILLLTDFIYIFMMFIYIHTII